MSPLVTIGVPLYNAERYLATALDSLLAQDHPDLELVICDNASTDTTWDICRRYASSDDRVRLYRNDINRGAAYNYNRVVELARGELFKWAAYDDVCASALVSRCVAELAAAGPGAVLAYPQTMLIGPDGEAEGRFEDRLDLRADTAPARVAGFAGRFNLCNAVFGLIRTDVLRRTGLIRPYPSSDVTLLAELAAYGRFHEVPEPLFGRRIHPASTRQAPGRSLADVAAWFDPRRNRRPRWPALMLALRTTAALHRTRLPVATRLGCAVAFLTRYGGRKGRAAAGRMRRTLMSAGCSPASTRRPR